MSLHLTDKLTKEEEEIYKLQNDLERTVISQQQSKKITEVSHYLLTQNTVFFKWQYIIQFKEQEDSY